MSKLWFELSRLVLLHDAGAYHWCQVHIRPPTDKKDYYNKVGVSTMMGQNPRCWPNNEPLWSAQCFTCDKEKYFVKGTVSAWNHKKIGDFILASEYDHMM